MSHNSNIKPGAKVELRKLHFYSDRIVDTENIVYKADFKGWQDVDKFCIRMSDNNENLDMIRLNEQFIINFFCDTTLLKCKGVVYERKQSIADNSITLSVRILSDIETFQRRRYFRINIVAPIQFGKFTNEEDYKKLLEKNIPVDVFWGYNLKKKQNLTETVNIDELTMTETEESDILSGDFFDTISEKATLLDISGGGMRFASDSPVDIGEDIIIRIPMSFIEGKEYLVCKGRVVFSHQSRQDSGRYEQHISFVDMDIDLREKLIFNIFKEDYRRNESGIV